MSEAPASEAAPPVETTPEPTPPSSDVSPVWADAENAVFSADFANHLGEEVQPFAAVLNQKYGSQPLSVLAKSYGEAQKVISEGGRPLGYPSAEASEGDWEKWNTANAVPDEASGYELFPEGQEPENLNESAVKDFQELLHQLHAPASLARQLAQGYTEIEQRYAQKAVDEYENQLHEANQALQRDWGPEYEERLNSIKAAVVANGGDASDPDLFDNPKVVRFLGKMVGLLGEDRIASWKEAAGGAAGFGGGGAAEAQRIMTDPSHPQHEDYKRSSGNDPINEKVNRLLSQG